MRVGRGFLLFATASMVIVACTSSDDSASNSIAASTSEVSQDTTAATTTDPATTTTIDVVSGELSAQDRLEDFRRDGASDLDLILAELSAYIGPIPGVPTIEYDESLHPSLTGPVNDVIHLRDDLTLAQQEVVDAGLERLFDPSRFIAAYDSDGNALEIGGDVADGPDGLRASPATTVAPGPTTTVPFVCPTDAPGGGPPDTERLEEWVSVTRAAEVALAADFPGDLDYVLLLSDPRVRDVGSNLALTAIGGREFPRWDALAPLRGCFQNHDCYIVMGDLDPDSAKGRATAAHELYHCWHYREVGNNYRTFHNSSQWVKEGLAEWVGEAYAGGSPTGSAWWERYFTPTGPETSRFSLFSSSYDAIGFWSHVATHTNLVELIPSIVREAGLRPARNDQEVLLLLRETMGIEVSSVAAGAPTQRADLGPLWTTAGPGMPGGNRAVPVESLSAGPTYVLAAAPGEQIAREVDVRLGSDRGAVLETVLANYGTITWSDGLSRSVGLTLRRETRCVGVCECPDGTPVPTTLADLDATSPWFVVALSPMAATDATFDANLITVDDACDEPERDDTDGASPSPRRPGRGGSFGHPNIVAFDGIGYVFHGAGDYALVESTTDDLAIHARFSRLNNMTGVSFNRAVAARVGGSVVTFGDDAESTAFDPAIVRVDGIVTELTDTPLDIGGEASLSRIGALNVLSWSDGTELRVGLRVGDQFDVLVPDSRYGQVVGLLGNADSDRSNDVATRSGESVDPHDFAVFYERFGASWLLDANDSLFESELDPIDIEPIVPSAQLTLADLSADARAEAERICREGGVTPAFGLSQCIFDVAMTGDSSWIRSVLDMREIIDGSVSVSALLTNIEDETDLDSGGAISGELSERFGADVFDIELAVGSTLELAALSCPEVSTFEMAVVSPTGSILDRSRGDDCGTLRLARVTTPGVYRIAVYDVGGFTGRYGVGAVVTQLGDGDQVVVDEPFELTVDDSGEGSSVSFMADAGDRLSLRHPTPDDDSNVGFAFYRLIGPDGTILESWPARDDREIQIAVTGTYTLLLDVTVGLGAGSVTVVLAEVSGGNPPSPVEIGVPFTMEVATPGGNPLATFTAAAGDRLVIAAEVPRLYFEAAATFELLGPDAAEIAWWFSFQDGEVDIPADGTYTLSFDTGTSTETSTFEVVIGNR